jgi:hypothetical protein
MEQEESFTPDYLIDNYIYSFKNKPLLLHIKLKLKHAVKLIDALHDNGYTKTKSLNEDEYLNLSLSNKDNTFFVDIQKFEYIMKKL